MSQDLRRLSDSILAAFDHAIAQQDIEVATYLYRALELVWTRPVPGGGQDRRNWEEDPVVPAHDRLEALRAELATPPTSAGGGASDTN